jgi:hypothetical protein
VLEDPKLEVSATPPDPKQLLLAVIERDTSNGVILNVDMRGRLRAGTLPPGSVGPVELADGAVQSRHIQDGEVTASKLADNAVSNRTIQDGGVTASKLADNAVSSRTIQDNAITVDKIANGSVTQSKVLPGSISLTELKATVVFAETVAIQGGGQIAVPPTPLAAGFYIADISAGASTPISWQEQWNTVISPGGGPSATGRQWLITNHVPNHLISVNCKIYKIAES